MAREEEQSLEEILQELLRLFPGSLDFAQTSAQALPEIVSTLTTVATSVNLLSVNQLGGRIGPERSKGLVEQVVAAAFQTFGGEDPHPGPFEKAAMLLRGITQGHPFSDGNKRTGFMVATYYLNQVGYPAPDTLPRQAIVDFCLRISAGDIRQVEEIARQLAMVWEHDLS
ncbi:MAG: Fic family protein [Chloroflexota bacterium]|nr:MAG: Fic family protein [Chloroflexota bacterium]